MCKRLICTAILMLCGCGTVLADELPLSAASAVIIEADSGDVIYEKDAHTARPMASTTKLMTALIAAESLPSDREITVSKTAVLTEGSSLGLRAGDLISVSDLLTGLLLASGNDAANMTAEAVAGTLPAFADLMNAKAAVLGMHNSHFVTPSGLDAAGHAASAYDMALLGRAVLQNRFLRQVCATEHTRIAFGAPKRDVWVKNHNRLLSLSADCIGMKTGFTKKSGRCLVSAAVRDGVTVVAVTLNGGDDWNDHLKLYEYAFSRWRRVTPDAPALPPLAVAGGTVQTVTLQTEQPPAVSLPRDVADTVSVSVQLPAFVWAPLRAGETAGTVTYRYGNGNIVTLPITLTEDLQALPPLPFRQRFFGNCQHIFRMFLE